MRSEKELEIKNNRLTSSKRRRRIFLAAILLIFATVTLQAQSDSSESSSQTGRPQDAQQRSAVAPAQPGQLPNSVSVPPLTVGEKFKYRVVASFGIRGL